MSVPGPTADEVAGTAPSKGLEWRRVHPVTPLVRGWGVLVAVVVIFAQNSFDDVVQGAGVPGVSGWLVALGVILGITVVALAWSALAWRMTSYAVDDDAVHLRSGVLFRQQRKAQLDRLQAVDLRQPLVGRLVGLAELRLEVAGGSDSAVRIGFLRLDDAEQLRRELLARAAGVHHAGRTGDVAGAPGDASRMGSAPVGAALEAPERTVLEVPPGRVFWSTVRSGPFVALVLGVLALVGVTIGTREPVVLFAALPAVLGGGSFLFSRFSGGFGFRSAISPDGVRLRHGLLEQRSQTIPPGRVQAVRLLQPLAWRDRDWWRVEINVAGYGQGDDDAATTTLLPVGTRDEAVTALWLVLPDLGADDPRALLDEALVGSGPGERFTTSPREARWLDPWSWRRNGFAVTGEALVLRRGRFRREADVVPHARTQSLGVEQGPVQRRFGVASFRVHSTPGPVSPAVHHLDPVVAARLIEDQARRAREARAVAPPEQWMRAVGVLPAPDGTEADVHGTDTTDSTEESR